MLQSPFANAVSVKFVERLFAARGVRLVRAPMKPASSVPDHAFPAASKIVPVALRVSVIPPLATSDTGDVWTAVFVKDASSGVLALVKFHSATLTL